MDRIVRGWMVVGLLLGTMTYAIAEEEVTLTTYYPSPRGVYDQLRSRGNTFLATTSGNVGIGAESASAKLDVNGPGLVRGKLTVEKTDEAQPIRIKGSGATQAGWVLTAVDANGNAEWRAPTYQ